MVFYDSVHVYTNSSITSPDGELFDGPSLYGHSIRWRKAPHHDSLLLPDGSRVPVGLMSFAAPTKQGGTFFVMAAPSFWRNAGIDSKELSLDKLLTGVFLHEFTHCRQFDGFGAKVNAIEQSNNFSEVPLSDDIVQGYFKKDSLYEKAFRKETELFYRSATVTSKTEGKKYLEEALAMLKTRQQQSFTGNKKILMPLDDIFLSMEGLGQYVGLYWLMQPGGGNIPTATAISGFRRKKNQWSQEEGLALFLALAKHGAPGWQNKQFGTNPTDVVQLLEKAAGSK